MCQEKEGEEDWSIENCVDVSIQRREDYFKKSQNRLITPANYSISNINTDKQKIKTKQKRRN